MEMMSRDGIVFCLSAAITMGLERVLFLPTALLYQPYVMRMAPILESWGLAEIQIFGLVVLFPAMIILAILFALVLAFCDKIVPSSNGK